MDLWQDRYGRARAPSSVVDIRTNEEFLSKKRDLEIELIAVSPSLDRFVSIVLGRIQGDTTVERAAANALCFFQRHLKLASVDSIPQPTRDSIVSFVSDTAYLGLATEFAIMNHPARSKITAANVQAQFDEFLEASIVAKAKIRGFDDSAHKMPSDIFRAHYALMEPVFKKDLGVGFWKSGKVQANVENVFFAGAMISMMACTRASRL